MWAHSSLPSNLIQWDDALLEFGIKQYHASLSRLSFPTRIALLGVFIANGHYNMEDSLQLKDNNNNNNNNPKYYKTSISAYVLYVHNDHNNTTQ